MKNNDKKSGFFFWFIFILFLTARADFVFASETETKNENTLIFKINETRQIISQKDFASLLEINTELKFEQSEYARAENIYFCPTDYFTCALYLTERKKYHIRKTSSLTVNEEKTKKFLETVAAQTDKEPTDAKFKIEEGKIINFAMEQNGIKLDIAESLEKIKKAIADNNFFSKKEIELVWKIIEPKVKSEDINKLEINTILGEGISNFRGSPQNRIHNIKTASQVFNGILIKPEEEFSFIKTLGPVDEEHGYLPELVIKNNETVPEFGGGICQVSTSAFRAAIYSGLKITERHSHAYPVPYYNPQGIDATVYIPRPDLKFINNTPGYILIQTEIKGTKLIFRFYGTSDNRKIEVDGPFVTEKGTDGSMKTYFIQKVYDSNQNLIIEENFKSYYESPNKYPHPGQEPILTKKPKDWSKKQWKEYQKTHNLN